MDVSGEAVGAMQAYLRLKRYILPSGVAREALQAALPFIAPPSAARELALEEVKTSGATDVRGLIKTYANAAFEQQGKDIPKYIWHLHFEEFATAIRALSSPDHAGAFPQSKNEGRLSELNVEPGEVFERISGHDRHSDNLIGAKYISKDTGPYCQRGLHLERIPSGTGWTTMDDRGIFRRLSCDAGKVEGDGRADLERFWRPISEADKSITFEETFDLGDGKSMTIRNSDHYWVRDADGRVYEATWSDHKGGYWWDLEGESPADPVEYMPHPLSLPSAPSEGAE